ncbi:MAG: carboxypeptidase-like regulatory domain-containing protein [Bacteroidota bacterium]
MNRPLSSRPWTNPIRSWHHGWIPILFFLVLLSPNLYGQSVTVNGRVMDETSGDPVIGASVIIQGSTRGMLTGDDGQFSLNATRGDTLTIRFLGYESVNIVAQNSEPIEVLLQSSNTTLDEVVVIGYGAQRKSDLTGSVASVQAK